MYFLGADITHPDLWEAGPTTQRDRVAAFPKKSSSVTVPPRVGGILWNLYSVFTDPIDSKCVIDLISFFSTQYINSLNADSFLTDIVITEFIIIDSIKDLSVNSAAGHNGIPASLLKHCSNDLAPALHILFTDSILSGNIHPSLS